MNPPTLFWIGGFLFTLGLLIGFVLGENKRKKSV